MTVGRSFQPTAEQLRAIQTRGSAVVRAGAGSGKTSVLAARYVQLVGLGLPGMNGQTAPFGVEKILAITFTDKAASEMKERIRTLLAERLREAGGPEQAALERARRELVGAQIATIHSFCAHLIRENPIEAGVDPAATVLDQRQAEDYLEMSIERELRAAVVDGQEFARKLVKARSLPGAISFLRGVLGEMSQVGLDPEQLEQCYGRQVAQASCLKAQLARELANFVSSVDHWLAGEGRELSRSTLRDNWPWWREYLHRLASEPSPRMVVDLSELAAELPSRRREPGIAAALRMERGKVAGSIPELAGFLASLPSAELASRLVAAIARAVAKAKRLDRVLTFDDLIRLALKLLLSDGAVRRRYQERYRAVLVDEFQDVDARQGMVIKLLSGGSRASLFLVGDEKQSIYGFRGADVEVMGKFRSEIGHDIVLQTNFRAVPSILRFVNGVASLVMQPPADPPAPYWVKWAPEHELTAARKEESSSQPSVVLLSLVGAVAASKLSTRAVREIEADRIASMIVETCATGERSYGEIAIILRAMTQARIYEEALRRHRVPYRVIKGGKFFDCQEVRDLVSLIAAVDDPTDELALAALLRSPFFSLSDDSLYRLATSDDGSLAARFSSGGDFPELGSEGAVAARASQLLAELRGLRDRLTVAEMIEEAVRRTNLEAVLLGQFQGEQKVANVRKFIELAREAERERQLMLGEFACFAKGLVAAGAEEPEASVFVGQEDLVSLMSVHQAKGLEFPVVILPDLGRAVREERARVAVDSTYGLLISEEVGAAGLSVPHRLLSQWREEARDRREAESARLLYVALTRARDLLILSEGKGSIAFLKSSRPARRWVEHIWDLIGRREMLGFATGELKTAVLEAAGTRVRVESIGGPSGGGSPVAGEVAHERVLSQADVERVLLRAIDFESSPFSRVILSPVELGRFDSCPRMYFFNRSGVPVGSTVRQGLGSGPAVGTVGHAVLQTIDPLHPPPDVAGQVARQVEAFGGGILAPEARERLGKILVDAVSWIAARYRGLELIGREVPFAVSLGRQRPAVVLRGRMDFLGRDGKAVLVADYKFTSPRDLVPREYLLQLAAYTIALQKRFAEQRIYAEILFLGAKQEALRIEEGELEAARQQLPEIAARLVASATAGEASAFPKAGPDLETCTRWGCFYTSRCW